ncbi:hypothetical protein BCR33DRAFT_730648 [Rhizoclosmatium globosum]|uniref:peptidylprolyl isomerase n=1 Tax=Rhizoclosmatium globosum TaxID=329046 RepID=A0A1Y2ACI5_9FUNG|nr:hypothetical protein BCR33DRAFT_730648 [Rhizoclosmatium globosum]|eukprot:ORY19987.1 hypothetical protein BCR33DRAFT_730648 [Rhizoclosmatium globosum]
MPRGQPQSRGGRDGPRDAPRDLGQREARGGGGGGGGHFDPFAPNPSSGPRYPPAAQSPAGTGRSRGDADRFGGNGAASSRRNINNYDQLDDDGYGGSQPPKQRNAGSDSQRRRKMFIWIGVAVAVVRNHKTIITPGDGVTFPVAGTSTVTVLYTGTFMDGTIFDASSLHGNVPFSVVIGAGKVIPCWDLGVPKMSVGEVAKLWCSWQQAYGENGDGQNIPPKSDLNFQVTLISIS